MDMNKNAIEEKIKIIECVLPNIKVLGESVKKKHYLKCHCKIHDHSWEASYYNLKKGSGCPECKREAIGNALRLSLDEVRKEFVRRGFKPLFEQYKNSQTRLLCENDEGYKVLISLGHLKNGKNPSPFGNGNPYTYENIRIYLAQNLPGYELISNENSFTAKLKLDWKCDNGHNFNATWGSIKSGRKCSVCYRCFLKTTEEFRAEMKILTGEEYTLLSEYEKDNVHVKVKHNICGNEYKVTPSHFLQGKRCPNCAIRYGEKNNKYNPNLTDEDRIKRRISAGESIVKWRNDVYERDNYTCQCCKIRGGVLHAHHLNGYHWYKEGRFDVDNGVTLCKTCHFDFHNKYGRADNTKEQFQEYINNVCKPVK